MGYLLRHGRSRSPNRRITSRLQRKGSKSIVEMQRLSASSEQERYVALAAG